MAQILELISETGKSVDKIIKDYPEYKMIKEKYKLNDQVQSKEEFYKKLYKKIKDKFDNYEINLIDGVKINNENEWLHIRLSNTEPQVRLVAESLSEERCNSLIDIGKNILNEIMN